MESANSKKNQLLGKVTVVVDNVAPGSEVYLYGSRGRGDAKGQSDWNLLILVDKDELSFDFETKLMDAFYEVELETGEVIVPLIYSKTGWYQKYQRTALYEAIGREGLLVY